MKILQVSTTGFPDPRYYRSNELVLCKTLAKLGHDVTLFSSDRHPKWQIPERRTAEKKVEILDGFTLKRFPCGIEIGIAPVMPTLLKDLFETNCDVVHAHYMLAPSSFYSAVFARIKHKPLIVTEHDYLLKANHEGSAHGPKLFAHILDNNTFGRCTMKAANVVIALSSAAARFAEDFGAAPSKTRVIPSSVDTSLFRPDQKNLLKEKWSVEGRAILSVGKLVKEKAPSVILRAFHDVALDFPDTKLVMLGKGPEEPQLRELQERLGLKNVYFIPRVPLEQMQHIYPGALFLVLPSLYEPFGNAVLEAMASGLPVIGSWIGGMAEVITHGETGFQIEPGNRRQLSKYMQQLLADETLRRRMSTAARKAAVERFDDIVVTREVEKIYNYCLKR
jgi:glycosyltransferase involved in cell wall biosynthesis